MEIDRLVDDLAVFNEELGAVIQVRTEELSEVQAVLNAENLANLTFDIGTAVESDSFEITRNGTTVFSQKRSELRGIWAELTHQMQRLRDNPECADQEFAAKKTRITRLIRIFNLRCERRHRRPIHQQRRKTECGDFA